MKGYIQVYTGEGKGKTTAALGLALRAAGAGMKVYFAQFLKGRDTSELNALAKLDDAITVGRFGSREFVTKEPSEEDRRLAVKGLAEIKRAMKSGRYGLIVLDEANAAVSKQLFSVDDLLALIDHRPDDVELVITGRDADPRIVARADLVTEMRAVKHYFDRGVPARRGIEL